jgi:glycosyltransferase involved in cell wall biosynthesis
MRVGFVTGEYPPMQGGVGAYTRVLAQTLVQQGHEIAIFSSGDAHEDDPNLKLTNRARRWSPAAVKQIARWAADERIDVLNVQYQTAAFNMSPWIHFIPDVVKNVPVVTTFHDLRVPYLFPKAGRVREWIVKYLARQSDGAVLTNHEDMERIQGITRACLIPIGSNIVTPLPDDFDPQAWRTQASASDGDFLVGHFGFINHSKGVPVVLAGIAKLRAQRIPARLVLIGGRTGTSDPTNAAYADEIDRLIADLDLKDCIHWTGYVDDATVSAYLSACDVVTLPFLDGASFRRGTLMAAIHHGCAILTTQPGVAIDQFRADENMLLVPPNDADALGEALRRLHDAPELRDQLRAGAKVLAQRFDWQIIAADLIDFFRQIQTTS